MGVAVRAANGEMKLLTGNQIGSLIAYYRAEKLFENGILNKENAARGVIIKTFVTTDLQKAIAEHYGLRCVETLTGFKYIGAKLGKYEARSERLPPKPIPFFCGRFGLTLQTAQRAVYREISEDETRRLRLAHSSYYVFGGEESYGYSGQDFVRDKDGNAAAIMFCEVAAYAKSRGLTIDALLDEVFSLRLLPGEKWRDTLEGAEGAAKIKRCSSLTIVRRLTRC